MENCIYLFKGFKERLCLKKVTYILNYYFRIVCMHGEMNRCEVVWVDDKMNVGMSW